MVRDASAAVEEVHVAATASRSGGLVLCRCLDGRGVCGRGISRGHLRLTLLPRSVLKECVHSEHGGRRKREELKPRSTKVIHFLLVSRIPQPASHAHKFINSALNIHCRSDRVLNRIFPIKLKLPLIRLPLSQRMIELLVFELTVKLPLRREIDKEGQREREREEEK